MIRFRNKSGFEQQKEYRVFTGGYPQIAGVRNARFDATTMEICGDVYLDRLDLKQEAVLHKPITAEDFRTMSLGLFKRTSQWCIPDVNITHYLDNTSQNVDSSSYQPKKFLTEIGDGLHRKGLHADFGFLRAAFEEVHKYYVDRLYEILEKK